MSENLAPFRQGSWFWAPLCLWILAWLKNRAGLCLPWVRVTHFSFVCLPGWPLPDKKRLVLMLGKSHLFSNSDLYCSAKLCFHGIQKMERGECEGSSALNCLCPSGDLRQRLIFGVKILAPWHSWKMEEKSFLQLVAGREWVIYWEGNLKMFLPKENVDALSAWTVQTTNDWC